MRRLSSVKMVILVALGFCLWASVVYIRFFASREALRFVGGAQLDKVLHFAGGVFFGIAAEWLTPRVSLRYFLTVLGVVTMGWEIQEFLFDSETYWFYVTYPKLWALDSAGDIVVALLGSYGYWVFARDRSRQATP